MLRNSKISLITPKICLKNQGISKQKTMQLTLQNYLLADIRKRNSNQEIPQN